MAAVKFIASETRATTPSRPRVYVRPPQPQPQPQPLLLLSSPVRPLARERWSTSTYMPAMNIIDALSDCLLEAEYYCAIIAARILTPCMRE
jgi:hypothetical protein